MTFETARYKDQLLTTRQQLDVLREYNQRCWMGHFSEAELAAIDVSSELPELDNVPVLHAEFGSAWDTLDAWRKVYMSDQTTHFNTLPDSRRDFNEFVRPHERTARYEPGLHIVHMDLTRDQDTYHDMKEVYADVAEKPGLRLAHSEALALVGLHRVFRESAGGYARRKTPYLPGYQARNVFVPDVQAGDWDWVPRFDHGRSQEGWGLRMFPIKGDRNIDGAVLFVRGNTGSDDGNKA
jgi:hypothetical protein